jgi:hypothetical protein
MRFLRKLATRAQCFWRGHSRRITLSYLYREEPRSVVDDAVICRCVLCGTVLPSSTSGGITTVRAYRRRKKED